MVIGAIAYGGCLGHISSGYNLVKVTIARSGLYERSLKNRNEKKLSVKIPVDAIIPEAKLTKYLLAFKPRNDKSRFLAKAGFTVENSQRLKLAIQQLSRSQEAIPDRINEYGTFYSVSGTLQGINGIDLLVVTIWLERKTDNKFQFITLKPGK